MRIREARKGVRVINRSALNYLSPVIRLRYLGVITGRCDSEYVWVHWDTSLGIAADVPVLISVLVEVSEEEEALMALASVGE